MSRPNVLSASLTGFSSVSVTLPSEQVLSKYGSVSEWGLKRKCKIKEATPQEGQDVFLWADMWPQLFTERWFSEERNPLDGYDNGFLNLNKMLKAGPTSQPVIQYWDWKSKAQDSVCLNILEKVLFGNPWSAQSISSDIWPYAWPEQTHGQVS